MEAPVEQTWVHWLMGACMALLSVLAAVYRKKIEALESGQKELVKTHVSPADLEILKRSHVKVLTSYVSREDLDKHLTAMATSRTQMHEETTRKFERLEDGIKAGFERIHDRIDDIPSRPPNARTRSSDR